MLHRFGIRHGSRHTLSVPGNGISQSGIDAIKTFLCREVSCCEFPDDWSWDWLVGGKGEYVGSLPKRIAKWFRQKHGIKLIPEVLSEIGNLGSVNCDKQSTYYIDFNASFEWCASEFGDRGSCIMTKGGGYSGAREMLRENDAIAIRFFTADDYCNGYARAFIADMEDYCILFNGYGIDTIKQARILAQLMDNAYYYRLGLNNFGSREKGIWINGDHPFGDDHGIGYAIGPQEIVTASTTHDLRWDVREEDTLACENCGRSIDSEDHYHNDTGEDICERCYDDDYTCCDHCGNIISNDYAICPSNDSGAYCTNCAERFLVKCSECNEWVYHDNARSGPDRREYCESCHDEYFVTCGCCGDLIAKEDACENDDGDAICGECHTEFLKDKEACNEVSSD